MKLQNLAELEFQIIGIAGFGFFDTITKYTENSSTKRNLIFYKNRMLKYKKYAWELSQNVVKLYRIKERNQAIRVKP
ncbi:MAG: hypothetical protein LBE18_01600 [Planctomycetaceae bacterium]|jgi:hypothetical protein|nr:hypothetical protein [Planctomycetaceae bacterium]